VSHEDGTRVVRAGQPESELFDLGARERAERFLAAAELVTEASSFGGVQTTAERRLRWRSDEVPEGFIRLSAGCEETADLVADLERALDA
jgi:cystathionine gamma-lyase